MATKPGLWANIRAKRARGEKPAHKNSNAHKDAVAAGKKIKEGEGIAKSTEELKSHIEALSKARAQAELDDMNMTNLMGTLRTGTADDPKPVSAQDATLVRNATEAALKGTGPAANFAAFMDNILSVSPVDIPGLKFEATQSNRQFLEGLIILGRSALVVNPKFPVAEMNRVEGLFPQPSAFFRNPETEASKLVELKKLILEQKRRNLTEIAAGIPNAALLQAVQSNNFEIDRLLSLLTGVNITPRAPSQDMVDSMRSTFTHKSQLGN